MTVLEISQQGHIVTLTINRPDMRNALGEPGDGQVFLTLLQQLTPTAMCVALS